MMIPAGTLLPWLLRSPCRGPFRRDRGSVAMGIGIWSMHFAGMLATSTPWRPGLGMTTAP